MRIKSYLISSGSYFGQDAVTYDYKWLGLSVMNPSPVVIMMWYIWEEVLRMFILSGSLSVISLLIRELLRYCEGSHNLESFARLRNTYGGIDVDRDMISEGWFSSDPYEITDKFGGRWLTTNLIRAMY